MNWSQFKDPVWYPCIAGAVVTCWSLKPEVAALKNHSNYKHFSLLNSVKFTVNCHCVNSCLPRLDRSHLLLEGSVFSSLCLSVYLSTEGSPPCDHYPRCITALFTKPPAPQLPVVPKMPLAGTPSRDHSPIHSFRNRTVE